MWVYGLESEICPIDDCDGDALQAGETPKVYRRPDTLRVAQVFSDPPLNVVSIEKHTNGTTSRLLDATIGPKDKE